MKKNRLESLHIVRYFDLERYPPILNLLDCIHKTNPEFDAIVCSIKPTNGLTNSLKSIKYRLFGLILGSQNSPCIFILRL